MLLLLIRIVFFVNIVFRKISQAIICEYMISYTLFFFVYMDSWTSPIMSNTSDKYLLSVVDDCT